MRITAVMLQQVIGIDTDQEPDDEKLNELWQEFSRLHRELGKLEDQVNKTESEQDWVLVMQQMMTKQSAQRHVLYQMLHMTSLDTLVKNAEVAGGNDLVDYIIDLLVPVAGGHLKQGEEPGRNELSDLLKNLGLDL